MQSTSSVWTYVCHPIVSAASRVLAVLTVAVIAEFSRLHEEREKSVPVLRPRAVV